MYIFCFSAKSSVSKPIRPCVFKCLVTLQWTALQNCPERSFNIEAWPISLLRLLHANSASITLEFLFNSPHLEIVATEVEIACEHALSSCQSSFHLFLISPVLIITETTRACLQATVEISLKPDSTHAFSLVADEILANEECLQIICCP